MASPSISVMKSPVHRVYLMEQFVFKIERDGVKIVISQVRLFLSRGTKGLWKPIYIPTQSIEGSLQWSFVFAGLTCQCSSKKVFQFYAVQIYSRATQMVECSMRSFTFLLFYFYFLFIYFYF